jgi:arylsulfatase A-like enzyme
MPFRNGGHKFGTPIRPGLRTMPMYFSALGYHTAHFGKFHHGPRQQFPYDKIDANEKKAAAYLRQYAQDKPLLLVVCTRPPHTPWLKNKDYNPATVELPPNFVDTPQTREDRANYYTDVTEMDRILGQVMDAIEAKGIADNTLLIHTTDQGANWPFGKWCLYDAGIRVPLLARWPSRIRPRTVSQAMVSLVDLLPTMMEAAGARSPAEIDGRSFLDVLRGKKEMHRDAIFAAHTGNDNGGPGIANDCPMRCIRTPTHKLIVNLHPERTFYTHIVGSPPSSAHYLPFWNTWVQSARTDPAAQRIVEAYLHRPSVELYDLAQDPYEMNNLAADPARAETLTSLHRRLDQWREEQGDPETAGVTPTPRHGAVHD